MLLNIKREWIHKIGGREAFLKIFMGMFNHENRMRPLYKVAFDHENRIRVLEGRTQITEAQFLAAIDGLDQVTKKHFINALRSL